MAGDDTVGMRGHMQFRYDCDGLIKSVRDAANPAIPEFLPYRGNLISEAVLFSKLVMRKARALRLYVDPVDEQVRGAA
jgi:hypothetical protein